jgi:thiol-disulfide isomerase/thioredoxin
MEKAWKPNWRFWAALASLLIIATSVFLAADHKLTLPNLQQHANKSVPPAPPTPISKPTKTYALSTNAVPETGGEIRIVSPSSSSGTFEPNSQITLMAIPDDCYTLNYWDGASDSSETITITMDSNKSVTAHFRLKDTTPPAISAVKVTSYSDVSATITWETDKPATSHVEYGKTKDYGLSAESNGELTTSHKIRLMALEPGKTYCYMVKSQDKCGNVNPQPTSTKTFKTLSDIPVGYEVGKRPPPFTLPSYQDNDPESPNEGQEVSLSDFKGKKILLNFWSTRCGPCLAEFPIIREIYHDDQCNKNTGNVAVITIGIDNRPDRIKLVQDKYQAEYGRFTFPILLDIQEEPTKDKYGIWRIPTTVFIDSDGIIREIKMGRFKDEGEIIDILNRLD